MQTMHRVALKFDTTIHTLVDGPVIMLLALRLLSLLIDYSCFSVTIASTVQTITKAA